MPLSGIGFGEMLVIGMLVLIVFGPRRLPEISRSMGKAIREFKRGMNEIQRELDVADRESRRGASGTRAAGAAGTSAVSRPAETKPPSAVIAPPALVASDPAGADAEMPPEADGNRSPRDEKVASEAGQ